VRSRSICGFNASDISNNIRRCERTQRDVRVDGVDHRHAVFQIAGRSTLIQNDHAVALAVGDVALIDSARPVTYVNDGHEQWLSLQLPRQLLFDSLVFARGLAQLETGHTSTFPTRSMRPMMRINVHVGWQLHATGGL
jgi:hypothetical protein